MEPIELIHSDAAVVVVAKRCGVPSQPDRSGDASALSIASQAIGRTLYPLHRIDRPASGVLLFAVTPAAAAQLSREFAAGTVARRYWAIVAGTVEADTGVLNDLLVHDRRVNRARVSPQGKWAELAYEVRARGDRYTLLEIELITGRHHQIRAQLANAGWPIRGDLKYGARRSQPVGGIALHAVSLAFDHPVTHDRRSYAVAPPDETLWHALTDGITPRS